VNRFEHYIPFIFTLEVNNDVDRLKRKLAWLAAEFIPGYLHSKFTDSAEK